MAASSVPNGFTADDRAATTPPHHTAIILKDEWAKIGVNVDIQQLETSALRAAYHGKANSSSTGPGRTT